VRESPIRMRVAMAAPPLSPWLSAKPRNPSALCSTNSGRAVPGRRLGVNAFEIVRKPSPRER
jgi:hypothetical protein